MINTTLRIRPSKSGKILLFLTIFLFFAAQNTGNNLLYLLSSCFMTCIIWTGTMSFRNISDLQTKLILPDSCFVGQTLTIRCRIEGGADKSRYYLGFEDDFLTVLRPGERAFLRAEFTPERRGTYSLKNFRIFSSYPADLFLTCIEIVPTLIKVAPAPVTFKHEPLLSSSAGWAEQQQAGKEGDYWMQVPYQEGNDASQISWGISARSMHEWVVIRSTRRGICRRLYCDFSGSNGEDFEKSLQIVSGLIWQLRCKNVDTFIWGEIPVRGYQWLSVKADLPLLVDWLASIRSGNYLFPTDDGAEPFRPLELIKDSV